MEIKDVEETWEEGECVWGEATEEGKKVKLRVDLKRKARKERWKDTESEDEWIWQDGS